jgi:hypothetical protein
MPLPHPTWPPLWLRLTGWLAMGAALALWGFGLFVVIHFVTKLW